MAQFIAAFRGAGSPGNRGAGSTQFGLARAELARQEVEAGRTATSQQRQLQGLIGTALGRSQQAPLQGPVGPQGEAVLDVAPQAVDSSRQDEALREIFRIDPDAGKKVFEAIGAFTEQQQDDATQSAFLIRSTPPEQREQRIRERAVKLQSEGRDASDTVELLDMTPAQQDEALKTIELAGLSNKERLAGQAEPVSDVDKARAALIRAQTKAIETPVAKLSPVQQKVAAEGLDPNSPEGQQRVRELNQRSGTDPTKVPTKQEVLNKATEGQLASASFAIRVGESNKTLLDLENKEGFDPTSVQAALFSEIAGGNIVLTEDQQVYQRSKRDIITAILRKESGAAIGVDEFDKEDKKLFPQIGDKPAVLKQKQKARGRAFDNLRRQSKGVYEAQLDDVITDTQETAKPDQGAGKTGGVLHEDAQGNKAMVFPDGSFEEVR